MTRLRNARSARLSASSSPDGCGLDERAHFRGTERLLRSRIQLECGLGLEQPLRVAAEPRARARWRASARDAGRRVMGLAWYGSG